MLRPRLSLIAAAALLAGLAPGGVVGQATPVQAGRTYTGGTALASPLTGVSLRLPSGVQAQWEADLQGRLRRGHVVLEATDGRYFRWPVEESGAAT